MRRADPQRRLFLLQAAQLSALAAGPGVAQAAPAGGYPFSLGVASGSPLPDSVILWTRVLGTSVTSNSRPQAQTLEHVGRNPHIRYGRSDRRGFMLLEVTPAGTSARFMGLDDVRDARSGVSALAAFDVADGRPGLEQTA